MVNPWEVPPQLAGTPEDTDKLPRQEDREAELARTMQIVEGSERGKALTLVDQGDLQAHSEWVESLADRAFALGEAEQAGLLQAEAVQQYRELVRNAHGWWQNAEQQSPELFRQVADATTDIAFTYRPMIENSYLTSDAMRAILRSRAEGQGSGDAAVKQDERGAYVQTWHDAVEAFREGFGRSGGIVHGVPSEGAELKKLREMEAERDYVASPDRSVVSPRLANGLMLQSRYRTYELLRERGVITDRHMWGALRVEGEIPVPEYIQVRAEADRYYSDDVVGRVSRTEISGEDRASVWIKVKTAEKLKRGLRLGAITAEQFDRAIAALGSK